MIRVGKLAYKPDLDVSKPHYLSRSEDFFYLEAV